MKPRKKEKKEKERKEKNRKPKNSTERDGGLINSEQDKHLERRKKEKKNFQVQEQWSFSFSSYGVNP
jgi:hypothetical protein